MQTPQLSNNHLVFTRYGLYVAGRLKRLKHGDLEQLARDASMSILARGRSREDIALGFQELKAQRDAIDDELDAAAQTARRMLAARAQGADRSAPYTDIFPRGIGYYIAAPLDEQVARYEELIQRLKSFLPEDDPVRAEVLPLLEEGTVAFAEARKAVREHRIQIALARTELTGTKESFNRSMNKIYGLLLADDAVGKAKAEQVFPKTARKRSGVSSDPEIDMDDTDDGDLDTE